METNFWGPMRLTRRAVGIFRDINPQSGVIGGTIVNVSSIGGRIALPAEAPYHASKFALEGFSEALRSELDPRWKIRVLLLEPGGTKSSFTAQSKANSVRDHPAYTNAELPVNQMIAGLTDPGLNEKGTDASNVARCLFNVLQKDEIPLRLPTGQDAYEILERIEGEKIEELKRWKKISTTVGNTPIPDEQR